MPKRKGSTASGNEEAGNASLTNVQPLEKRSRSNSCQLLNAGGQYPPEVLELADKALDAKEHSYSPYSKFRVGAAVLTKSGKMFTGCNVENASYPLGICAERTAYVKAISEGESEFSCVVVASDIETTFCWPCGSCRQFMNEFGNHIDVYSVTPNGVLEVEKLHDLLPKSFGPKDLEQPRTTKKRAKK